MSGGLGALYLSVSSPPMRSQATDWGRSEAALLRDLAELALRLEGVDQVGGVEMRSQFPSTGPMSSGSEGALRFWLPSVVHCFPWVWWVFPT